MKDEYDILLNMINIIFSSCSIITITEKISRGVKVIVCEAFDCFFEYQIYKIMEKYRYYDKIRNQYYIIKDFYFRLRYGDPTLRDSFSLEARCNCDIDNINVQDDESISNETINILIDHKIYRIKVDDKYKQDMLELMDRRSRIC